MRQRSRVQSLACEISARSRRVRGLTLTAVLAAMALAASACSGDTAVTQATPDEAPGVPRIVATTGIWADVVANVACDGLAEVETVIPVGGDPHGYEPSLQDRERMENASLVVANGLGLEEGLEDTLEAVAEAGTPVFEFAEEMEIVPFASDEGHDDHDDEGHDDHDDHDHDDHDDHDDEGHDDHDDEEGHDDHDDHDHDDHDDEGHDDHDDEEGHDDHDHDDDEGHDDHDDEEGHDDHDDEGHDDEGHDDHDDEGHDDHDDEEGHDDHDDEGHDDHDDEEGHDDHDDEGHDDHDDEGHDHSGGDPHVWFDPHRVSDALPALARVLTTDVGLDAAAVEACLSSYIEELETLDAEIAAKVEQLPAENRKLVTNHEALGYYAERYGFEVIGTVIPSPASMAQASPAQLEELAEIIEHEGIPAIFAETQHSVDDIESLASRVGDVEVVTLYTGSLGPAGSGAETYVGFLRTNTELIVDALS